jgi:alpha-L-fucosidase 2
VTVPVNGFSSRTRTDDWEQALITGNGRQGALCYGGPRAVRVTVSHERLFLPLDPPLDPPHTAPLLPRIRALLREARYADAANLVVERAADAEPAYRTTRPIDPFIGAATLTCTPYPALRASGYRRGTDFGTGVVTQRWETSAGPVGMSAFVSRAHDVVAVRLHGPVRWSLRLAPIAGRPPRPIETSVRCSAGLITLNARFPDAPDGALTGYAVICQVTAAGVVLLRTVVGDAAATLDGVPTDWTRLLRAHAARHRDLYHRVRLELGTPAEHHDSEDLLAAGPGPDLVRRLFDAGRYAVISATGERPPVLQGVWSGTYRPAWSSGYTVDGNLPAAVSALLPTGCPELMLPVFDLVESVLDDLRRNARRLYGVAGILVPVHLSTHGRQNHFGPVWCQTFWTAGAAWLARLYYEYWCHTGDRVFLATRALPFMRLAAQFYLDFAAGGSFAPSYSPENAPVNTGSQACVDATMDVAAVRGLLRDLVAGTATLGVADPDEPAWRDLLAALAPYRVGPGGELCEWVAPDLLDNHAHRHASHLYPLWYDPDPAIVEDPVLRRAAGVAVRRRLEFWRGDGSGEMAYGLAQVGLAAAQLGLADAAWEALTLMAARYWRPNLVSTHNRGAIFNVDICGGMPAVVAAMLVGSAMATPGGPPGRLHLLPALPAAWPTGSVRGLVARNAVTVRHLAWTPDGVEAVLKSATSQCLDVTVAGESLDPVRIVAGRPVRLTARWPAKISP